MVLQFARAMGLPGGSPSKPSVGHVIHVKSKGTTDLTALPSVVPPVPTLASIPNQSTSNSLTHRSLANSNAASTNKHGKAVPSPDAPSPASPGTTTLTPFWEATPQHPFRQPAPLSSRRPVTKLTHTDDVATPNPAKFTFY